MAVRAGLLRRPNKGLTSPVRTVVTRRGNLYEARESGATGPRKIQISVAESKMNKSGKATVSGTLGVLGGVLIKE